MKITITASDIEKLNSLDDKMLRQSLTLIQSLQNMSLEDAEASYKSTSQALHASTREILDRNFKAETKRIEALKKRRAQKATAPKNEKKTQVEMPVIAKEFISWLAANWKKINDFFSINKHINSLMSPRMANRYKEMRALIAAAPQLNIDQRMVRLSVNQA